VKERGIQVKASTDVKIQSSTPPDDHAKSVSASAPSSSAYTARSHKCELCHDALDLIKSEVEMEGLQPEEIAARVSGLCRRYVGKGMMEKDCKGIEDKSKILGSDHLLDLVTTFSSDEICADLDMCPDRPFGSGVTEEKGNNFRFQEMRGKCDGKTCEGGQKMVYRNWFDGCVCDWHGCKDKSFAAFNLCRRACYYGDSMCAQCFPSSATVEVKEHDFVHSKRMDDLRIGDKVRTENGFSTVFAWMDNNAADVDANYLHIHTSDEDRGLKISSDHIVFAHNPRRPVHADTVRKGDILWVTTNRTDEHYLRPVSVQRIENIRERGLHAPLTRDGTLIVNGILASSYAKSKSLMWGNAQLVSGHHLNMFMHAPLRWVCGEISSSYCAFDRWHIPESGRHYWTQWILDNFGWLAEMNRQHPDIRQALWGADASAYSAAAAVIQVSVAVVLALLYALIFSTSVIGLGASAIVLALGCRHYFSSKHN